MSPTDKTTGAASPSASLHDYVLDDQRETVEDAGYDYNRSSVRTAVLISIACALVITATTYFYFYSQRKQEIERQAIAKAQDELYWQTHKQGDWRDLTLNPPRSFHSSPPLF